MRSSGFLALVVFAACGGHRPLRVAVPESPEGAPRVEASPSASRWQGHRLRVEVLDVGRLLDGDERALAERVEEQLAASGAQVAADASEVVRFELTVSSDYARGEDWCVEVSGFIDRGEPAFLPRQLRRSKSCMALDAVTSPQGVPAAGITRGVESALGVHTDRKRDAVGRGIRDVLQQLAGP